MQSVVIPVPDVPALPFGLVTVADIKAITDVHTLQGFEYQTQCGYGAGFAVNPCTSLTGATTGGSASNYPASVTINSDLPGSYVITWGEGTPATNTVTFVEGDTVKTTSHTFTTTGNKTVTVVGPVGFGTRTIVLNASTTTPNVQGDAFNKAALPSVVNVIGDPVTMVSKYQCTPIGVEQADQDARAMDGLNRSRSQILERAFKARVLDAATVTLTSGGTTYARALALLENYAAVNYAGVPTIHVDRFVGSMMTQSNQIGRVGDHLETTQGARVASGAGYSSHPLPGTTYAYVTGMVVVREGVAGPIRRSMDYDKNLSTTIAERTSVFGVECIVARAEITTT